MYLGWFPANHSFDELEEKHALSCSLGVPLEYDNLGA